MDFSKVKVEVIIPFHKVDNFLFESIASAKNSLGVDVRLILVNDTGEIISRNLFNIDNGDILIDSLNKGYSGALRTGISSSSAEYVAFLDSDDLMDPNKLCKQLMRMNEVDVDFVSSRIIKFRGSSKSTRVPSFLGENPKVNRPELLLLLGSHGADSSLLTKGESLRSTWGIHGIFPPSVADFGWLLNALSKGLRLGHEPSAIYFYRSHEGQLSRNISLQSDWSVAYPYWAEFSKERLAFLKRFNSRMISQHVALAMVFPSSLIKLNRNELDEMKNMIQDLLKDLQDLGGENLSSWKAALWSRYLIASRFRGFTGFFYLPYLTLNIIKSLSSGLNFRKNA
jgi:glycosyltransferase involved in cell wall biosynthesis